MLYLKISDLRTPLFDTSGTVHSVRLKQHGLLFPALNFENVTSIRRLRVSEFFVAPIQRIQSQRAMGVISIQSVCAFESVSRAFLKSVGTLGSGHSLVGSIVSFTV